MPKPPTTGVVDLGVGNTASLIFALERLGHRALLTSDAAHLAEMERLLLPGVGHAGYVMGRVEALGLGEMLQRYDRPLLGICLGLQLLFDGSDEGDTPTLGRIPGRVAALAPAADRPVPHMGWNRLHHCARHPLTEGVSDGAYVYFVHGYAAAAGPATVSAVEYGGPLAAIAANGRAMGCQFHPERSGAVGARILKNFMEMPC